MSRFELVTPVLETKFHTTEPLRQWCNKGKLDDMFDSLSFLLGCKLFFYFSLFASCHSEVWRVSLQVFESKIDQKRCCFTLLLMKRTSTQQRRFMNTNYPTFSGTDVKILWPSLNGFIGKFGPKNQKSLKEITFLSSLT